MATGANTAVALTHEAEITAPVDLCLPDGRLNRAAVGWSRRPLHTCNLSAGWPWRKRWEFWGVLTDTHLLRLTYGCTDYLGLLAVAWLDRATGKNLQITRNPLLARGLSFPATVGGGELRYADRAFEIAISELPNGTGTRLQVNCQARGERIEADIVVANPTGHQSLNVVIPWSDERFQFTSKQNTRPASGYVVAGGQRFELGMANHAFGFLDFGRGVWPYRTTWNWGAAAGMAGGRVVGLNLGGRWTDGTGCTENGVCVDGILHKIGEDLVWTYDRAAFLQPWRIYAPRSKRIDLTFAPRIAEDQRIELVVLRSELHWVLGTFSGHVLLDDGTELRVDQLPGWAEEHCARW
jgi:hypothetical protein